MRINGALRSFRNLKRFASTQQKEKHHKDKQNKKSSTSLNQPTKCTASSSRSNSVNVTLESAYTDSYSLRRQSTTSILSSVLKPSSSSSISSVSKKYHQQPKKSQVAYIQTSTGLVQQLSGGSSGGSNAQLQLVCQSSTTASLATYKLTNALASSMRTSTALVSSDKAEANLLEIVSQPSSLNQSSTIAATAFHSTDSTVNMDNLDKRSIDNRNLENKNNQQSDFQQQATTVNISDQSEPANTSFTLSLASSTKNTSTANNNNNFSANQQQQIKSSNSNNVSTTNTHLNHQTSTDTANDFKNDKQNESNKSDSIDNQHLKTINKEISNKESTTINLTSTTATSNKVGYSSSTSHSKYPQPTTTPANSPPLNQQPILLNYVSGVPHQNLPMRNVPLSAHHNSQTMNTETILHAAAAAATGHAAASQLSSQLNTVPLHNQRSLASNSNDSDCSGKLLAGQGKRSKNSLENFHLPNEGYRLGKRKLLFEKRKRISDYCLVCALFGIFMMIAENELTSAMIFNKVSKKSFCCLSYLLFFY